MRNILADVPRDIRIFTAVTLLVLLAAVLVTVVVVLASRDARPPAAEADEITRTAIDRMEFILPDESGIGSYLDQMRIREQRTSWSRAEVDELWIDPAAVAGRILAERNREQVERILDGVQ